MSIYLLVLPFDINVSDITIRSNIYVNINVGADDCRYQLPVPMIEYGYAYENPNARYVSEVLVINKVEHPKLKEDDWRLVVNLKKANAACEPYYWPLPTIEEVQRYLVEAKYFMILDLKSGSHGAR